MSSRGLVLCFCTRLRANVVCYSGLKTTSFAFFTLVFIIIFFLRNFKQKIHVVTERILYRDDTLDEEDVSIIFDELEVSNPRL